MIPVTWCALFVLWCVVSSAVDLATRRLPNLLTGVGAAGLIGWAVIGDEYGATFAGAGALFGCYLVVHLAVPRAFGAGDVKLAFTVGGVAGQFGVDAWAMAAVTAPLLTGAAGMACVLAGRRHVAVPHGPAMCAATLLAITVAPT
ncbi:prepilin peptidase [Rhodococcus sp. 06-1059B-a]|nr:prepilin peptidase [Rhodococcus sp. 06-1059B-a]